MDNPLEPADAGRHSSEISDRFGPRWTLKIIFLISGIIGDIRSFAIGIAICGGLITAGSFFTGILKFHGQE